MERYAIGMQDFGEIRKGGYVYVDKTSYIEKLLAGAKYYFLARPRRFGKSLFLSTLEYFFLGDRELFKGLAIETYESNWEPFPVIHIDFGISTYTEGIEYLKSALHSTLQRYEDRYNIVPDTSDTLIVRFNNLIRGAYEKTGKQVVVLVDEYEKPVLDTIDHDELCDRNKDFLRGFYGVLKSLDKYLKFVFLTGVTKFGQMNVFSGLNNIRDISLLEEYGAICGITEKEMIDNFPQGIEDLARAEEKVFEEAVQILKENYDGYHFSRNCPDIYNPYSLVNAFADKSIKAYWSYTGTPALLVKILFQNHYDLEELDGVEAGEERLLGINNRFDDPVSLFYQTGYLTLKGYDKETREYILGYPNREVQKAFFNFVLPYYYDAHSHRSESVVSNLNRSLIKGDPWKAMEYLESFSSGISYDVIPIPEVERHFQSILYIVVKLLTSSTVKVTPEWKTSDGRIDLLIETPKYVYIIEIKRDQSPEQALKQVKEKDYALQFRNDARQVFLIGMNFSTQKKRLDGFLIEER